MKKRGKLFFCCIIFMFVLNGCSKISSNVESTNLSDILIDNITIGSNIKSVDLTKYVESERYSENYTHRFDEIVLNVNNDIVDYLFSRFDENKTTISVNGKSDLIEIDEVSNILGNNFEDKLYDNEQGLKTYKYYDHKNNIEVNFVYSSYNNSLTWIELSKIK